MLRFDTHTEVAENNISAIERLLLRRTINVKHSYVDLLPLKVRLYYYVPFPCGSRLLRYAPSPTRYHRTLLNRPRRDRSSSGGGSSGSGSSVSRGVAIVLVPKPLLPPRGRAPVFFTSVFYFHLPPRSHLVQTPRPSTHREIKNTSPGEWPLSTWGRFIRIEL